MSTMPFWFNNLSSILQFCSYIAIVIAVGGVFFAYETFKKSTNDTEKTDKSKLMDNSIKVLEIFSKETIPSFQQFNTEQEKIFLQLVKEAKATVLEKEGLEIKDIDIPEELNKALLLSSKIKAGGISVLNCLEQVCAYVSYDLILDDVVYPTLHKVFLDFYERNDDLIKSHSSEEVPYKNIHFTYEKWKKTSDLNLLEKKQSKLNEERTKIEQN